MTMKTRRLQALEEKFRELYGTDPQYKAVAPGRANLIGEHIDHQGYGVLPVALSCSMYVAVGSTTLSDCHTTNQSEPLTHGPRIVSPTIHINHCHPEMFAAQAPIPLFSFVSDSCRFHQACLDYDVQPWVRYVLCGVLGIIDHLLNIHTLNGLPPPTDKQPAREGRVTTPLPTYLLEKHGDPSNTTASGATHLFLQPDRQAVVDYLFGHLLALNLLVDGDIPVAAGVSSSSALVVGATLALAFTLGVKLTRQVAADLCTRSERYVGTAGGGMDQSIILLAQECKALHIQFQPLRVEPVQLPSSLRLVLCHSGTQAYKATDGAVRYNRRVFELALASFLLLNALVPAQKGPAFFDEHLATIQLRHVQEFLDCTLEDMRVHTLAHISPLPYGKDEVVRLLGADRLHRLLRERGTGLSVWTETGFFEPLRRALHVFDEALRVEKFIHICQREELSEAAKIAELGHIINASDASLTTLFDCGTRELNALTQNARQSGALGSRLIGAGWGGCTLSLMHADVVQSFTEKILQKPPVKKLVAEGSRITNPLEALVEPACAQAVWDVTPARGAVVIGRDQREVPF